MQVRILLLKIQDGVMGYHVAVKSLFDFSPYLKIIDAVKKSYFYLPLKHNLFLNIARF
ncbi:hypothetical protein ACFP3I_16305 [Chryseobacterium arachidis]|uniref:hypothetical protein n=1 Tax=Chryseobacterium arachidis TaxID=1416778 RepID=UPI00361D488F